LQGNNEIPGKSNLEGPQFRVTHLCVKAPTRTQTDF
jgi:hypothetical protein